MPNSIVRKTHSSLSILPVLLDDLDQALVLCHYETLKVIEYNQVFSNWYPIDLTQCSLENIFDKDIVRRIKNAITKQRKFRFNVERIIGTRNEHIDFNTKIVAMGDHQYYLLLQGGVNSTEALLSKMIKDHSVITAKNKKQLEQAMNKVQAANKAKSLFLASISHELRTPMNGILGMVQQFYKTSLTHQQSDLIETIESSGIQLLAIINQILDFSKIEANKIKLHHCTTDIKDLLTEVILICTSSISTERKLEVSTVFTEQDYPKIMVDDIRLKQVLINLVSNAIKFTKQGSVKLKLALLAADNSSCTLEISVIDTGVGIEQEKIAELFKPFTQYDASTTRSYGGTGLGLSICHQLIKLMGSEIDVTSEIKQGSTFSFKLTLPISKQQKTTESIQTSFVGVSSLKGKTILVVDDNRVNRKIVLMALDGCKAHVLIAQNGLEAVEQFEKHHVDIVLMDCLMPVMDGFEATTKIRILERPHQHTLILALTANASSGVREQCIVAGMDEVMLKPFKFEVLLNKINQGIA